jgi:hypothetical protein
VGTHDGSAGDALAAATEPVEATRAVRAALETSAARRGGTDGCGSSAVMRGGAASQPEPAHLPGRARSHICRCPSAWAAVSSSTCESLSVRRGVGEADAVHVVSAAWTHQSIASYQPPTHARTPAHLQMFERSCDTQLLQPRVSGLVDVELSAELCVENFVNHPSKATRQSDVASAVTGDGVCTRHTNNNHSEMRTTLKAGWCGHRGAGHTIISKYGSQSWRSNLTILSCRIVEFVTRNTALCSG